MTLVWFGWFRPGFGGLGLVSGLSHLVAGSRGLGGFLDGSGGGSYLGLVWDVDPGERGTGPRSDPASDPPSRGGQTGWFAGGH